MRVDRLRPQAIRGASEQVAAQIQHHIQRQGLAPGSFLGREEDLAARFGVSRPTLREALKLLSSGNLIRATKGPGGGIFVANTAPEGMSRSLSDAIAMMLETGAVSVEELLDARLMLEVPLAAAAAYQSDPELIERLRAAVSGDTPDDRELHRAIAEAAGNRMMESLTGWIFDVLQPELRDLLADAMVHSAVISQHEALIAAIEKGDAARARRAMEDHLLYLRDVLALVRSKPS